MGLAHTRAGPGGAIARSGGKVVVLCYPLFVLPASAVLLDLSISLLGYEALVCTAARFRLAPHFCAVPLAAPEPQWGGCWGQGRRVRAKIRPPSSRKQLAGHCRAAAAR